MSANFKQTGLIVPGICFQVVCPVWPHLLINFVLKRYSKVNSVVSISSPKTAFTCVVRAENEEKPNGCKHCRVVVAVCLTGTLESCGGKIDLKS